MWRDSYESEPRSVSFHAAVLHGSAALQSTGDDEIAALITKTAAGKRELQDRKFALKRSARTLLVLADGLRTLDELMTLVRGSEPSDVEDLRSAGLVTVTETGLPGSRRTDAVTATAQPRQADAPQSSAVMGYEELYGALNLMCRDYLGLIKGYRFSMEIEKASGIDELTEVARRFANEVEQTKGRAAGALVRRALSIPD